MDIEGIDIEHMHQTGQYSADVARQQTSKNLSALKSST
jgi:hypothetical protein